MATAWHCGLSTLSNPLSTDNECAAALATLTALRHQCPREIAQQIKQVVAALRLTSDSVVFAEACDALVRKLPGACAATRIGSSTGFVDAQAIEHQDALDLCNELVSQAQPVAPTPRPLHIVARPGAVPAVPAAPVAAAAAGGKHDGTPMILEDLDHHAPRSSRKRKRAWVPGQTLVGWVSRGRRIELQSQALLVNGHRQLFALGFSKRSQLRSWLTPVGSLKSTTVASQILSGLLRLSARTIEAIVQQHRAQGKLGIRPRVHGMRARLRRKVSPASPGVVAANTHSEKPAEGSTTATEVVVATTATEVVVATTATDMPHVPPGFLNLVRASRFLSSHGMAKNMFPGLLNLIVMAKGDVGTSNHSPPFVTKCEHAADHLLCSTALQALMAPLPGTGLPPDVELIADAGTVGKYYSRCRDTVLLVGMAFSISTPPYTVVLLIGCINEEGDARGPAVRDKLAKAFARLGPLEFARWVHTRIAVSCGDGALVSGGPSAKHPSTHAMDDLWVGVPNRALWDLFHRIDAAGSKALKQNQLATALFSVLKRLEQLFGLGQGRHVDRCVAAFLGVPYRVCKSPAGNRKAGYLCGVPQRFVEKYQNYYYNIIVRMSHALDGRGTHTFKELRGLGEALTNQPMCVFTVGLVAGLANNLAAITLQSQDAGDLPWVRWRALQRSHRNMVADAAAIGWLRVQVRVLALVLTYTSASDIKRFWTAMCFSTHGRRLFAAGCHLGAHVYKMLLTGVFQQCQLLLAVPPLPQGTRLAHPACQCGTRPQPRPGSIVFAHGGGLVIDESFVGAATARAWPERVKAPWWVSRSRYSATSLVESGRTQDPWSQLPRWQTFPADAGLLLQRACRGSLVVCESLKNIDEGLVQLQRFWVDFAELFSSHCMGDVGLPRHMRTIFEAMSIAWWLPDVVSYRQPLEQHENAIGMLYEQILPDLQRRAWPDADSYNMMPPVRRWPNGKGLLVFYRTWWRLVHAAANKLESKYRLRWTQVVSYIVRPVVVTDRLLWFCRKMLHGRLQRFTHAKIANLLHGFLFSGNGLADFKVLANEVRRVEPGIGMTTLRTRLLKRRVVLIVSTERVVNQTQMAADLEQDNMFANGCWHINRLFCFCRRMGCTEVRPSHGSDDSNIVVVPR